ncbi:sterol uptake control protein 2 [Triangularia setosa]|uniref:Sterol uptake control protein 2 n=1 Tax=Triangularia setosa TaxID=2587417 RepID=A0AAN6WDE9_9PEZI|nr:sterol uptake control protein 2 [Podospora setosa]
MARLKLGYTKSRTGCLRCKQRRVKCDENTPCNACIRHNVECSLVDAGDSDHAAAETGPGPSIARDFDFSNSPGSAGLGPSRPLIGGAQPIDLSDSPSSLPTASNPFPYFEKFITSSPTEDPTTKWVSELELLHHWTTDTVHFLAATAHDVPEETQRLLDIWQVTIPRMAFELNQMFMLHQMLAVTSYHLAHLRPGKSREFTIMARHHQSIAIRGISGALTDITSENCHAVFATSALLFVSTLSASHIDFAQGGQEPNVGDLVSIFRVVRGIFSVLNKADGIVRSGPLQALFTRHQGPRKPFPTLDQVAVRAQAFLLQAEDTGDDDMTDPAVRSVIIAAANALLHFIPEALEHGMNPEYRIVTAWPMYTMSEFVQLLKQRHHPALALLSYYMMIIDSTSKYWWYMKGWGPGVVRDILRTVKAPWDCHPIWALNWMLEGAEN